MGKPTQFSASVCQWTLRWLKKNNFPDRQIVRTSGLEMALRSLEKPLKNGTPPDMVIVDRSLNAVGIDHFSNLIADCMPEVWVVEMVSLKDNIQPDTSVIYMKKPFLKNDWHDLLRHCFIECPTPQWSKSLAQ